MRREIGKMKIFFPLLSLADFIHFSLHGFLRKNVCLNTAVDRERMADRPCSFDYLRSSPIEQCQGGEINEEPFLLFRAVKKKSQVTKEDLAQYPFS